MGSSHRKYDGLWVITDCGQLMVSPVEEDKSPNCMACGWLGLLFNLCQYFSCIYDFDMCVSKIVSHLGPNQTSFSLKILK